VRLGGYDTSGNAYDVAVSGTLAYVADDSYGLQIIDVSNPAAPVRLGGYDTTGSAYAVAVSGSLVYVADGSSGLQIINVSNPAAPVRLGGYDTAGSANGLAMSGSLAYVADGSSGLQIINVSNPGAPVRLGGYDTAGSAYGVAVSGSHAYVSDGSSGLQIIDVSNPAVPVRRGGYDTAGSARSVTVTGTVAYVADYDRGLQIIDVSTPVAPVLLGSYDTSGSAYGIAVSGRLGYVADGSLGLQIVDTYTDAAALTQVDATTWRAAFASLLAEGAYHVRIGPNVSDLAGHLMDQDADGVSGEAVDDVYSISFIIDTTAPMAPGSLVFADNTGSSATDNLTSDTTPTFTWSAATDLNGIARYEYRWDSGQWSSTTQLSVTVAGGEGEHLFEVRGVDPAGNIGPIASRHVTVDTKLPPAPTGLDMDGAVLFWNAVTDANGIWKYQYRKNGGAWADVAGTSISTGLADGVTATFDVRAVDNAGNAGVAASATLTADYGPRVVSHSPEGITAGPIDHVDITFNEAVDNASFTPDDVLVTLKSPVSLGYCNTPGTAYGVQVVGTLAYVGDYGGVLRIIDVSNPAAPVQKGFCGMSGHAYEVQVVGTLAYVADDYNGLRIIDVSNPAAPVEVGHYDTPDEAYGVQVVGTLAYVADWSSGLCIIDVSNPAAPVLRSCYNTPGYSHRVQVVGTLAYVACRSIDFRAAKFG
jgi:hypothetical protein